MFTILKLLASSGILTGAMKARFRDAKQAAAGIAVLTACGTIAAIVGTACLAAAIYLALLRVMADYEAALAVGGGFILLAAAAFYGVVSKTRRALSGRGDQPADGGGLAPSMRLSSAGTDPIVRLITESVQSPVVMSALVLGIAAGRFTKRARRD